MKAIEAAPDMIQRQLIQTMGILSSENTDWSDRMSTAVSTNSHK